MDPQIDMTKEVYVNTVSQLGAIACLVANLNFSDCHDMLEAFETFIDTSDVDIDGNPFTNESKSEYKSTLLNMRKLYEAVKTFKLNIPLEFGGCSE